MADNVKIKVGIEQNGVKTGLAAIRNSFTSMRGHLAGIIASVVGGFAFEKAIEKAREIGALARKFGTTAEEVQKIGAAAKKAGTDMETAAKGGFKAFIEAQKAITGDKAAGAKFAALGIGKSELKNLKGPLDTLLLLAEAVHRAKDEHLALAAASDIVGVRQAGLIQLLRMGADRMREIGEAASVMSNETVTALDNAGKASERFKNRLTILAGTILGNLGPQITWIVDMMERLVFLAGKAGANLKKFAYGVPMNEMADDDAQDEEEYRQLLVSQAKLRADAMNPEQLRALGNDRKADPAVRLYAKNKLKNPDKEGDGEQEAESSTAGKKQRQVIADALTRAGGGGVAYMAPEQDSARETAKNTKEVVENTREIASKMSVLVTRNDPAYQQAAWAGPQ